MTQRQAPVSEHLIDELLIRSVDGELSCSEAEAADAHLARCEECKKRHGGWLLLSDRLESAVNSVALPYPDSGHQHLRAELDRVHDRRANPRPQNVLRQFSWAVAAAAMISMVVFLAPHSVDRTREQAADLSVPQFTGTIEVDGESFVSLPYSNPDLPVSSSHVVQMQVPVSSLADAGVVFEPISRQVAAPYRTVLADVLVGMDGQPLGVHVLSSE